MLETSKPEPRLISYRQRIFARYLIAILVDLTVLNVFVEYWDKVVIDSFSLSILAAILLQLLLRGTVYVEYRIANYFKAKSGKGAIVLRVLASWQVLFWSKFVILGAIDLVFGEHVEFDGIVTFFVVVISIFLFEIFIYRIFSMGLLNPKDKNTV